MVVYEAEEKENYKNYHILPGLRTHALPEELKRAWYCLKWVPFKASLQQKWKKANLIKTHSIDNNSSQQRTTKGLRTFQ